MSYDEQIQQQLQAMRVIEERDERLMYVLMVLLLIIATVILIRALVHVWKELGRDD